ncbi:hypothetical protein R6Q59_027920 [Mikania micrantha]
MDNILLEKATRKVKINLMMEDGLSKNLLNKMSGHLLVMKMLWLVVVAPLIMRGMQRRNLCPLPPVTTSCETTVSSSPLTAPAVASPPVAATPQAAMTLNNETNGFDEFDPRGSFGSFPAAAAAPPTTGGTETDQFVSPLDPLSLNLLALVPVTILLSEADALANLNPPWP